MSYFLLLYIGHADEIWSDDTWALRVLWVYHSRFCNARRTAITFSDASNSLRSELRRAGYSGEAIDAVWPEWWSSEAEASVSAVTELRYSVARRLGISPTSLFEGSPKFIWQHEAKYKNLGTTTLQEQGILTSFGVAIGRVFIRGYQASELPHLSVGDIRRLILANSGIVDLRGLVAVSWGLGIPIVQSQIFPLKQKRMHAMSVGALGRYAILLGRESSYASQAAFTIAHELGHIFLGHIVGVPALLDVADPATIENPDSEEAEADRFALELLTGVPDFRVEADASQFTAGQVAEAAIREGMHRSIDPGILALSLGYSTGQWPQAIGALKIINKGPTDIGSELNQFALKQIDWDEIGRSSALYAREIIGG